MAVQEIKKRIDKYINVLTAIVAGIAGLVSVFVAQITQSNFVYADSILHYISYLLALYVIIRMINGLYPLIDYIETKIYNYEAFLANKAAGNPLESKIISFVEDEVNKQIKQVNQSLGNQKS